MATTAQAQLSDLLEQVAKELDIPEELRDDAVAKYEDVAGWMEEKDKENRRSEPKVYPQGSFRLGTVVRPLRDDDEYDLDLVYERDLRKTSITQEQLKEQAGEHLAAYIEDRQAMVQDVPTLEEKSRCWRLEYEGQFHMDVLPAIPDDDGRQPGQPKSETAVLIADEDLHDWQHSNPIGFAEWFKDCMREQFEEQQRAIARERLREKGKLLTEEFVKAAAEDVPDYEVKTPLQRAVQILKRHRDIEFKDDKDNRPASIIFTTLAARAYRDESKRRREGNLVDVLLNIVRRMPHYIEDPPKNGRTVPWVPNPVNDEENFADRWQDERYPDRESKFREWLKKVETDLTSALEGGGIHKVVDRLGGSLGRSIVEKAAASMGTNFFKSSQAGTLGMATGTGALTSGAGAAPKTSTPVRRHTFYGEEPNNKDA